MRPNPHNAIKAPVFINYFLETRSSEPAILFLTPPVGNALPSNEKLQHKLTEAVGISEMAAESLGGMLYGYKSNAKIQPEHNDVVWVNKRHDPQDLRSNAPVQRSKFLCDPPVDISVPGHWRRETEPALKTFSRHLEEENWYPSSPATRCEEWSTLRQILPSKGIPNRTICPRWGTGMPLPLAFHHSNQKRFPHINSPMTR